MTIEKEARQAYCISCMKLKNNKGYHDPVKKSAKRQKRLEERLQSLAKRKKPGTCKRTPEEKAKAYESVKAWRAENRDKYNALDRMYKKMKRSIRFLDAWGKIVDHYGKRCLGCGFKTVCPDHVQPLKPETANLNCPANLQPLCRSCNSRKMQLAYDWRPDAGQWILANIPDATKPF